MYRYFRKAVEILLGGLLAAVMIGSFITCRSVVLQRRIDRAQITQEFLDQRIEALREAARAAGKTEEEIEAAVERLQHNYPIGSRPDAADHDESNDRRR